MDDLLSQAAVEAAEQEGRSSAPLRRIALRYQRRWRRGHVDTVAAREESQRLASAEHSMAVAERRAEMVERRLASVQALLQHGLALPVPDMPALLAAANARMTAPPAPAGAMDVGEEETLDDPRAFWTAEEEGLLQSLDSDQALSVAEEEAIYKRLAEIDTLRQRHEKERAAFEKRQAARLAARTAMKAADEWRELRASTVGRVEQQSRVLRAAALLSGARQLDTKGDAGDLMWSEMESSDQRAAEVLGWNKQAWDAGKPAEACSRPWGELAVEEQICAATLGWNDAKWEKLAGRKRPKLPKAPPEADPPPSASPREGQVAAALGSAGDSSSANADDLDPSATLAGRLRFVSLSAEPTGAELVEMFDAHERQHLQALITAEFTNLYAAWLADPVSPDACAAGPN